MPEVRPQLSVLLPVGIQVRGFGRFGVEAAQGARGGERQAQTDVCRHGVGKYRLKDLTEKSSKAAGEARSGSVSGRGTRLSVRAACRCMSLSRAAWYKPVTDWRERDGTVLDTLSDFAESKPGQGFWKLFRRLRRQGQRWNQKRVYREYCRLGLNRRRRTKKRLPPRDPLPLFVPTQPNHVWSADFMSDGLYHGLRFRTSNVLDDFNREALAIEIDMSLPSRQYSR